MIPPVSGIMTRSAIAQLEPGQSEKARTHFLKELSIMHSRMELNSGELKPVLDTVGGEHFLFAKVLLHELSLNDNILEGRSLQKKIVARVLYESEQFGLPQVPQYAALIQADHKSWDFVFIPPKS